VKTIKLESRIVGNIKGTFIIPHYQRGFRWKEEVSLLLNDIDEVEDGKDYSLQPIVLKNIGEEQYELIDGQQRLTTIYLLLRYIKHLHPRSQLNFSLDYKIREETKDFLENIQTDFLEHEPNNMDELFIIEAYKIISQWFQSQDDEFLATINIYKKLSERISVIWYETDSSEDSVSLFTRLNIGRIPLTNAELVKALFLSRNNGIDERKQLEISTRWDAIEKELHDERFWYFITNESPNKYPTRIELLFDLMVNKPKDEREKFFTFFHFDQKIKEANTKAEVWTEIVRYYQRLKEWYENNDLYHKIGYLIACEAVEVQTLVDKSLKITKSSFHEVLDKHITESLASKNSYCDLSYERKGDRQVLERLLLLFNVETIRQRKDETMRLSFDKYKAENWTLEHIHAQEQEGLNRREQWVEWLSLHKKSLRDLDAKAHADLITDLAEAILDENLSGDTFSALFNKVNAVLSEEGSMEYTHSLANLALLEHSNNSALSNSTFDVKRNRIIEIDKTNAYIPVCTRHVFLKYYTPSEFNQMHFWGEADRNGYIAEMNRILKDYLREEITI